MYAYNKVALDDRVFVFIYGCAMHDAILQKSFTGEKKWVGQVSEARTAVKHYIDSVLCGEFSNGSESVEKAHEKAFLETVNAVCCAINTSTLREANADVFSFGNAQKLINMTVKHVYAHTYSNPSVRECFRYCHCPLDSIMLGKVWKAYKEAFGKEKTTCDLGNSVDFQTSWGNEGSENGRQAKLSVLPPRYSRFQNAIKAIVQKERGDMFPIEFDYIIWKN